MALKISELYGVNADIAAKLTAAGLNDSDKLLAAVGQPEARTKLASELGIDAKVLLELGNRADLARIKGIGKVYSDLLEFAGVDTVVELATRNADNLYAKIQEVAAQHSVVRLPRADDVTDWVAQAKQLDRALFY